MKLSNNHNEQLTHLYSNPNDLIEFFIENDLDEKNGTPEAKAFISEISHQGVKFRDNPELLVKWYNLQFGTSFTLDQVKAMAAQATTPAHIDETSKSA